MRESFTLPWRMSYIPGTTQTFTSRSIDSILLPARVSNSLLCFALTPQISRVFTNTTASPQAAILTTHALLTIESSVLQDLTDPNTGLPFNGKIELRFITNSESRRIPAGDIDSRSTQVTRSCQGALVSKRSLMTNYGLTQSQANTFFNRAITVTIGTGGTARSAEQMLYSVGLRLYGDRR